MQTKIRFGDYYMGSASNGANVSTYISPDAPIEVRVLAAHYEGRRLGQVTEMTRSGRIGKKWARQEILGAEGVCLAFARLGE